MLLSPSLWSSEHSINGAQHQMQAISQFIYQLRLGYRWIREAIQGRARSYPERGHEQAEPATTTQFPAGNAPNGTINGDWVECSCCGCLGSRFHIHDHVHSILCPFSCEPQIDWTNIQRENNQHHTTETKVSDEVTW
jgi:hypothetical protein